MLAALAFLRSPFGRYVALALALVAIALGLMHIGAQGVRKADAKRETAARADLGKHEAVAAEISAKARSDTEARQAQIQTVTRTLIQKVKIYVPAPADAQCVISVGFMQFHDSAAAGLPVPAGGPDETASGLKLSDVAATVAGNYGIAFGWREEALAWRAWYAEQKAAWERK